MLELLLRRLLVGLALLVCLSPAPAQTRTNALRVFVFAGQSNMVGSDSDVAEIERFPPFRGLDRPQPKVLFSYCLGREETRRSPGWVPLAPVNGVVGPELSFARAVGRRIDARLAIIKVAAGGTHLGGDWNPDRPCGFELYPLALAHVREALDDLERRRIPWRLEGFVWHQGENDMFEEEDRKHYGRNLVRFIARWRRDLKAPGCPSSSGSSARRRSGAWTSGRRSTRSARARMNRIEVTPKLRELTAADPFLTHVEAFEVPAPRKKIVLTTAEIIRLGELLAQAYLRKR